MRPTDEAMENQPTDSTRHQADRKRAHNTLVRAGAFLVLLVLLLAAWHLADVLLLTFAGILLAIFIRGIARGLHRWTRLPMGLAVTLVVVVLFGAGLAAGWYVWPKLSEGMDRIAQDIPKALNYLEDWIKPPPAVEDWLSQYLRNNGSGSPMSSDIVQRVLGMFSTLLGALTAALIIVVNGLYFSAEPGVYQGGLIRLVPAHRRARAQEVLTELGHSLRWWLVGRLASMTVVGILTYIGLMLLGLPSPVLLAVVAGLMSFIPNVGPVLSAVPAVLVGLSQSPQMALWVVVLYLGVQTVESYALTPLIQRKAVTLPPALLLASQLALGLLFGFLGLLLATPLTVVGLVLVQMLYVQDVLKDDGIKLP